MGWILSIIGFILIGALVGWLAGKVLTGWVAGKVMKAPGGFWRNVLLGIAGSLVGGIIGRLLGIQDGGWLITLLLSVGGSCLVLWLVSKLRG